jgi:hypothetical protein
MKAFFRASSGSGSDSGRSDSGRSDSGSGRGSGNVHSGRNDSGSGSMLMLGDLGVQALNRTVRLLL